VSLKSSLDSSIKSLNGLKNQVSEYCKENKETIIKIAKIVGISMVAIGTIAVMASFGIGTTTFLFSTACLVSGMPMAGVIMAGLINVVFYGFPVLEAVNVLLCSANYIIFSNPIFYITIAAILVISIAFIVLGIVVLKISSKYENEIINVSKNEIEGEKTND
jgi:small-conductance mechanosensitive channel